MKIHRKELLAALDSCAAGLGSKGNVEQSQCYVFRDGKVITFNDLIYTETVSPVPINAAIPAKAFRETLAKFGDDEINVEEKDGKVRVWVKARRASINGHSDVYLPIGDVEQPGEFQDVPPELSDALPLASDCAGKDGEVLDNLYIQEKGIVACDKVQAVQFSVLTGVKNTCLIPAEGCKAIASLGIAGVCDGQNWLHIKTYTGLRASLRKCTGEYPQVTQVFTQPVISKLEFPFSSSDVLERLGPFLADTTEGRVCTMSLSPGALFIRAKNVVGWFEERIDVEYEGPEISFSVNPKLIANATRHGLPLQICESSIRVVGPGFRYAVSISKGKQ